MDSDPPGLPDPVVPDPVPVPVCPPLEPGSDGVESDGGGLAGPVGGAEPSEPPVCVGCGAVGDAVGCAVAGAAGTAACSGAGTPACDPGRAGHGAVGAEDKMIAGASLGSVIPGRGGAAPIRADWADGLGAIAAEPAEAAGLAADRAAEADACFEDWQPEPDFAPEAIAGRPAAGALIPGAVRRPGTGAAAEGPPPGRAGPVASKPETGVPASTLELACTRASRSGPTETARAAQITSVAPVSAGVSRGTGTQAGRAKRTGLRRIEGQAQ